MFTKQQKMITFELRVFLDVLIEFDSFMDICQEVAMEERPEMKC